MKQPFDNAKTLTASCRWCCMMIRMREDSHLALCAASLNLVDFEERQVCEFYREREHHALSHPRML